MADLPNITMSLTVNVTEGNFTSPPASSVAPAAVELHSYGVLVFIACWWILVAVLGIAGNFMVILSAVLSESVRTMTNVLVVNLSVADLWTSLSLPWTVIALIGNGTWPLRTVVPCQIAAFMWHTGLGASLYILALISVNRLVRITRPGIYRRIFTPCSMVGIVFISWAIPFTVILLPLTLGIGSLGHDLKFNTCTDDDLHEEAAKYNLAQTIGFYPIPMVTVLISYIIIYIHIRRHFKRQIEQKKSNSATLSADPIEASGTSVASMSVTGSDATMVEKRKISRHQLQITKNLFLTCCAFMLLISPYFIYLFIPNANDAFALYGATILICNSCVNPIIYASKHPQFKKVLRPMLRCRWSEIPQPSKTLRYLRKKMNQNA
ncbi:G-protein coupled receptor moody-like [Asterias rubens]|uniref:G-protein coupled receptor moody-like n=1 Tax=Asterias rubens TaxID=7604 RepID=UPI0014557A37|nr:G-protein coupled receptor moody-like [Asterias rubens]